MSIGGFFGGLVIVAIGALVTIKAEWFFQNFGTIPTFDKYFGTSGGGRLGYKLIGIFITFIGFLVMTGLIGAFMQATLGRLFNPAGSF